jgi:hypothetical protein
LATAVLLGLASNYTLAQGDGPRAYLLAPKGVTGINAKWLNLSQNFIPAGSAFVPGADIKVNIFPTTVFQTFAVGGRMAQVYAMINPGSATARAKIGPPIGPIPVNELQASGLSDGLVAFKLGLYGAPALSVKAFMAAPMQFSLFADVRYWYSGTYDENKLFNMGTNRGTFQVGLPMAIPLNSRRDRASWLEVSPSVQFFTDNNAPSRSSQASKVEQKALFILENHFSHNFNPKFWAGAGLRFQAGGETIADGVEDNNRIAIMGGGLSMGYQILAPLAIQASYGRILAGDQEAKSDMFRIAIIFAYAKLEK